MALKWFLFLIHCIGLVMNNNNNSGNSSNNNNNNMPNSVPPTNAVDVDSIIKRLLDGKMKGEVVPY